MKRLNDVDVGLVRDMLPRRVLSALELVPGSCVAGGFVRDVLTGTKPRDIDLFCHPSSTEKLEAELNKGGEGIKSALAMTWEPGDGDHGYVIQLVTSHGAESPAEVICGFDFTVCQAAVFYDHALERWMSSCSELFYLDQMMKRLSFTGKPGSDLVGHMVRLTAKGYSIDRDTLIAVLASALNLNETDVRAALSRSYDNVTAGTGRAK